MKAECNVNQKELGSIVREMLAKKNHVGRQAFDLMNETPVDEGYPKRQNLSKELHNFLEKNVESSDAIRIVGIYENEEYIPHEFWMDGNTLMVSVAPNMP